MRAIKEELGPDAIIVSAKEVREGGRILRAFNRPILEVMAASDQDIPQFAQGGDHGHHVARSVNPSKIGADSTPFAQSFQKTLHVMLKSDPAPETTIPTAGKRAASSKPSGAQARQNRRRHLQNVVKELGLLLEDLSRTDSQSIRNQPAPLFVLLRRSLIEQGMKPSTADVLLAEAGMTEHAADSCDGESMRVALRREIVKRVRTSEPFWKKKGYPCVGLLIGPSGAGKTTAMAKLAAHYRLEQRRSVALITFDTYRENAVEQLRRYAKIVGVPFACAVSARQVHEGLRRHTQVDLVLIDMPGIGPADVAVAKELRRLLPKDAVMTHLVLQASTREQELCRMTRHLSELPQLHLLFTKLDETESFGTIFEVTHQTGVPLSYWSTGRRVPEDIEVASSERLATLLTMQRSAHSYMHVDRAVHASEAASALMGIGMHHG